MLQLKRLAPHLGLAPTEAAAALGVRSVALETGHLFRGAEMDAAAQAAAGRAIRDAVDASFAARRVGTLFGALACGADIVIAEAAIAAGIAFHAVLPFHVGRYAELSVDIGDPPGEKGHWRRRFDAALAGAASLTLTDDEAPLDRDLDGHFFYSFRFMAGLALLRAATLESEAHLIAVVDDAAPVGTAGSHQAVGDWLAAGRPLERIAYPFARKAPPARPRGGSAFRPVVLLWDVADSGADAAALKVALKRKDLGAAKGGFEIVARSSRVGGEGTAVVAPSLDAAIRLAAACAEADVKGRPLRVICDFGPVLGGDMKPDEKMIARLRAGADMPGFPSGQALATQSFTAQAVYAFGTALTVAAVGRTEERGEGDGRGRRRSGLPVYRLALPPAASS